MDYGAPILSLRYKGVETVASHQNPEEYINDSTYLCKTVGRYGNRIGKSRFTLDGREYILVPNEGDNQLHGGPMSFCERVWDVIADEDSIRMSISSPDGDNGFPGNLTMSVIFTIVADALHIDFEGETDMLTVFAPTIHPYFLCDGAQMILNAGNHVEVDGELIPTGNIVPCSGKYDYTSWRTVTDDLDDAFVIESDYALTYANKDFKMEVWTDFPAVQVYSGSSLGVAIEPEFYPDSPNHENFPDTTLHPGNKFRKYCEYKFVD